jgi:molecular chaperone GrpE
MFEVEDADKPAGTIVQILEPGYLIHDRLLRPAMVAVAKDKSEDTAKDKSEDDEGKSDGDEDKSDEGAQSSQADAPAEKSI